VFVGRRLRVNLTHTNFFGYFLNNTEVVIDNTTKKTLITDDHISSVKHNICRYFSFIDELSTAKYSSIKGQSVIFIDGFYVRR